MSSSSLVSFITSPGGKHLAPSKRLLPALPSSDTKSVLPLVQRQRASYHYLTEDDWEHRFEMVPGTQFDRAGYERKFCGKWYRSMWLSRHGFSAANLIVLFAAVSLVILYLIGFSYYSSHFYPGSSINDMSVSGMTVAEAEDVVSGGIDGYSIHVIARKGDFTLTQDDLHMDMEMQPSVRSLLQSQDHWGWFLHLRQSFPYTVTEKTFYSDSQVLSAMEVGFARIHEVRAEASTAPVVKQVADYRLEYVPGQPSTSRSKARTEEAFLEALSSRLPELDLRESSVYNQTYEFTESPAMRAIAENWNLCGDTNLSYIVDDTEFTLFGDDVIRHLKFFSAYPSIEYSFLYDFVSDLVQDVFPKEYVYDGEFVDEAVLNNAKNYYIDKCIRKVAVDIGKHSTDEMFPSLDMDVILDDPNVWDINIPVTKDTLVDLDFGIATRRIALELPCSFIPDSLEAETSE